MSKIITSILIYFLLSISIFAQEGKLNWVIIQDFEDRVVYIDTTSIKINESEITVSSLIIYRSPLLISTLQKKVSRVETKFWFDSFKRRYIVLQTKYFNEDGDLVGESKTPDVSLNKESYSLPIQSMSLTEAVMKKSLELKEKNRLIVDTRSGYKFPFRLDSSRVEKIAELDSKLSTPKIIEKRVAPDNAVTDQESGDYVVFLNGDKPVIKKNQNETGSSKTPEKPKKESESNSTTPTEIKTKNISKNNKYDASKERMLNNSIFTDGSVYCIQVSSWRNKSKAESEANKLKNKGHESFVTQAEIPSKGGTWYRVRVGYFNSLKEAENYRSKL